MSHVVGASSFPAAQAARARPGRVRPPPPAAPPANRSRTASCVDGEARAAALHARGRRDAASTVATACGRKRARRDQLQDARKGRAGRVLLGYRLALASDAKAVAPEWSPSPMNAASQRSPRPVVWELTRRITSETTRPSTSLTGDRRARRTEPPSQATGGLKNRYGLIWRSAIVGCFWARYGVPPDTIEYDEHSSDFPDTRESDEAPRLRW
jgi:hypothetical protein